MDCDWLAVHSTAVGLVDIGPVAPPRGYQECVTKKRSPLVQRLKSHDEKYCACVVGENAFLIRLICVVCKVHSNPCKTSF